MLRVLFFTHLREFTLGYGRLFIPLLQPLVRKEVLSHDSGDFFEVVKDGESGIFDLLFGRTEPTEVVIQVQSALRDGPPINIQVVNYINLEMKC